MAQFNSKLRRDGFGEISRFHGNTSIATLRAIYGADFAVGVSKSARLPEVVATLDQNSIEKLVLGMSPRWAIDIN